MKKQFLKAGLVVFLLIFLILTIFFKIKVLKLIKFWPKETATFSFFAYGKNFRGEISFACGDVNGEQRIVTAAADNASLLVKIFNKGGKMINKFDAKNVGQVPVLAVGDVDGDDKNEIILNQTKDKSQIFIYQQRKENFVLVNSFAAFSNLTIGVNLAVGDVNGDGKDEIIIGAGSGGGPQVKIFNAQGRELGNFFAFHPGLRGGVKVAVLDFDGDGKDEIVALSNLEQDTQFKIYKFDNIFSLQAVTRVYDKTTKIPVNLLTADVNEDGKKEVIVVPQKKLSFKIKVFGYGKEIKKNILNSQRIINQQGGASLAFCDLNGNKKDDIIVNENGSEIKIFYH
jgi:hypothetical protein